MVRHDKGVRYLLLTDVKENVEKLTLVSLVRHDEIISHLLIDSKESVDKLTRYLCY